MDDGMGGRTMTAMFEALLLTAALATPPPSSPPPTLDASVLQHLTVVCKTNYEPKTSKVQFACAVLAPDGEVMAVDGMEGTTDAMGNVDAGVPLAVWMGAIAKMLAPLVVQQKSAKL